MVSHAKKMNNDLFHKFFLFVSLRKKGNRHNESYVKHDVEKDL
jgi:hypothetical protein